MTPLATSIYVKTFIFGFAQILRAATPTEANAIGVHSGMFIPTIEKQGTEDQKAKWLPLARDLKIIGTYAQTELGHGKLLYDTYI